MRQDSSGDQPSVAEDTQQLQVSPSRMRKENDSNAPFSVQTHKRLRDLGKTAASKKDSDTASVHSSECSICLMSIAVSSVPFH